MLSFYPEYSHGEDFYEEKYGTRCCLSLFFWPIHTYMLTMKIPDDTVLLGPDFGYIKLVVSSVKNQNA